MHVTIFIYGWIYLPLDIGNMHLIVAAFFTNETISVTD